MLSSPKMGLTHSRRMCKDHSRWSLEMTFPARAVWDVLGWITPGLRTVIHA
eukprot:jgi/Mesvir1/21916/Mv26071-RA.1